MIKVLIVAVGKIKEEPFVKAAKEYEKRLGAFCELSVVEIKPEKLPENPGELQIKAALEAEKAQILSKIPKGFAVFPLCIEGKKYSSEEFAREIDVCKNSGTNVCFIIGGSHGLAKEIEQTGKRISFSDMTFPHRLFRIMLLEQIYRAFMINSGAKYHK